MRRLALLLALLLLLTTADAAPASPPQVGPALREAESSARAGGWDAALHAVDAARAEAARLRSADDPRAAALHEALDAARDALDRRDEAAALEGLALARAVLVDVGLAQARASLAAGAPDVTLLETTLDLHRPGPELGELLARLEGAPDDATLRDRALQRVLDRVAEEARVETILAEAAVEAGEPALALAHAAAASALCDALADEAVRLPEGARAEWDATRAAWADAVRQANLTAAQDLGTELRPVLLGLGFGRTITLLDDLGDKLLSHALAAEAAAARAQLAGDDSSGRVADAAAARFAAAYAETRTPLFLNGDGTLEALDPDVAALQDALESSMPAGQLEAQTERVREDLRQLAHLTFGAFAKIEFVHIPQGKNSTFTLQGGRFPLEGIVGWSAQISYDPAIARPLGATSDRFALEATWDDEAGVLHLSAATDEPLEGSDYLARLTFEAVGPRGNATDLVFRSFTVDGAGARETEIFLLRKGRVTVAEYDPAALVPPTFDEDPYALSNPDLAPRKTPLPAGAALVALVGAALLSGQAAQTRRR